MVPEHDRAKSSRTPVEIAQQVTEPDPTSDDTFPSVRVRRNGLDEIVAEPLTYKTPSTSVVATYFLGSGDLSTPGSVNSCSL
jgi:hypothetical protein